MGKYLKWEIKKNHIGMLLLLTAAFLVLNFVWLMMNLLHPSEAQLKWGWMMLLAQIPVVNAVLAPTFMAVLASRIADVEHKGSALKLLYTLQPRLSLYHAKLLLGGLLSLLVSIGQGLIVMVIGSMVHFAGSIPVGRILAYYGLSFFVTFTSYLLQLNLSLRLRNQMVPLAVGIIGSFCGLFVMYLYQFKAIQHVLLWTNYVTLSVASLASYDEKTRVAQYEWCPVNWYGIAAVAVWLVLLYLWGRRMAIRREV